MIRQDPGRSPTHCYDARGYWIAFIVGLEVFLREGEYLGRLDENRGVYDQEGRLRARLEGEDRISLVADEGSRGKVSGFRLGE